MDAVSAKIQVVEVGLATATMAAINIVSDSGRDRRVGDMSARAPVPMSLAEAEKIHDLATRQNDVEPVEMHGITASMVMARSKFSETAEETAVSSEAPRRNEDRGNPLISVSLFMTKNDPGHRCRGSASECPP